MIAVAAPVLAGAAQRPPPARGLSITQQSERKAFDWVSCGSVDGRLRRMRSGVGQSARVLEMECARVSRSLGRSAFRLMFLTLTYRPDVDWSPSHVRDFLRRVDMWLRRRDLGSVRCVWVAELQDRGAVHYHVALWLPRRAYLPQADRRGWWPHGLTQTARAVAPIRYLQKYVSKLGQKGGVFPKGIRLFGVRGMSSDGAINARFWRAPEWVRFALGVGSDLRKVAGGWVDRLSGEFVASPWHVHFVPGVGAWAWRCSSV